MKVTQKQLLIDAIRVEYLERLEYPKWINLGVLDLSFSEYYPLLDQDDKNQIEARPTLADSLAELSGKMRRASEIMDSANCLHHAGELRRLMEQIAEGCLTHISHKEG